MSSVEAYPEILRGGIEIANFERLVVASHQFLRSLALREAQVVDLERGYVGFPAVNKRIPGLAHLAAGITALSISREWRPGVIVGIPDSGRYLASAVNTLAPLIGIDTSLHASRGDGRVPDSWREVLTVPAPRSFTTEKTGLFFAIEGLRETEQRVEVVDDFLATAETASTFILSLQEQEVEVAGLVVLAEKTFQGGIKVVHERTGVPCAAILSIEAIDRSGITRLRDNIHVIS